MLRIPVIVSFSRTSMDIIDAVYADVPEETFLDKLANIAEMVLNLPPKERSESIATQGSKG